MASIRNMVFCITLLPFLFVSLIPSGMDLQIHMHGDGDRDIAIASCPLETAPLPLPENGQSLSSCQNCDEWMGYTLLCGGGPRTKSDYTLSEHGNQQRLTLPVMSCAFPELSPILAEQSGISILAKAPAGFHSLYLRSTPLLI